MNKLLYFLIAITSLVITSCTTDSAIPFPTDPPTIVDPPVDPPIIPPVDPPITPPTPNAGDYIIPANQQGYYGEVDFRKSKVELKQQLAKLLADTNTKKLTYKEVWEAIKATDYVPVTSGQPKQVYLIYGHKNKGDSKDSEAYMRDISKQNAGGSGVDTWNREHVYTQSAGNFDTKIPGAATDAHNLRSADVNWNGKRGNLKFAEGNGDSGPIGQNWYPGNEWKGDVARMMMYMYVRYGEQCLPSKIGVGSTTATPDGMIDLFLKWNVEDPVSDMERVRNEYHGNKNNPYAQGNRNPFIDNPHLATQIWGGPAADNKWSK